MVFAGAIPMNFSPRGLGRGRALRAGGVGLGLGLALLVVIHSRLRDSPPAADESVARREAIISAAQVLPPDKFEKAIKFMERLAAEDIYIASGGLMRKRLVDFDGRLLTGAPKAYEEIQNGDRLVFKPFADERERVIELTCTDNHKEARGDRSFRLVGTPPWKESGMMAVEKDGSASFRLKVGDVEYLGRPVFKFHPGTNIVMIFKINTRKIDHARKHQLIDARKAAAREAQRRELELLAQPTPIPTPPDSVHSPTP